MSLATERPKIQRATVLEMVARSASATLPDGVVGQVEGVALVYDVIDDRGTTFARGCLDRTVRERVAAGKVRLFMDHGDLLTNGGTYDTHLHIGVVREVWDTPLADGTMGAKFRADIFDTDAGRSAHEYLRAIAATGSETGVSIGMLRAPVTVRTTLNGQACGRISEVPLGEISITAMSSVPGTKVLAVRSDINYEPLLTGVCAALGPQHFRALTERIAGTTQPSDSDAASGSPASAPSDAAPAERHPAPTEGAGPVPVPYEERLLRMRRLFLELST